MKKRNLIIIFSVALFSLGGPFGIVAQEQFNAPYYKVKGDEAVASKNKMEAIRLYNKSLSINPDYVPALISLGKLLRQIDSLSESRSRLQRARKLEEKNIEVITELGKTALKQLDLVYCQEMVKAGLAIAPYHSDLEYLQSEIYIKQQRLYLAQKKLVQILRNNPGHAPSYLALGRIYTHQRRFDKAREAFERARVIDPENPQVFIDMALNSFQKVILEKGESVYVASSGGNHKRFSEAIGLLKNAIEYDPNMVEANLLLGKIYAVYGECETGKGYFEQVLRQNQNHLVASYLLGFCNPKENIKKYRTMLNDNQNHEILRYSLEKKLFLPPARRENYLLLERAREHYNYGKSLFRANLHKKAIFEISWARYLYPSFIPAHKELYLYYRSKKDFVKMADELDYLRRVTDEKEYQDMYEMMVNKRREKLYYRDGIVRPREHKTPTPIYVFWFRPENILADYPDAGAAIAEKLTFALDSLGRVNMLSPRERMTIAGKIKETSATYGNGLVYNSATGKALWQFYRTELVDNDNAPSRDYVRYVIDGVYKELPDGIEVTAYLVDLETGKKIKTFKMSASGRGYIRDIVLSLAKKIYANIRFHGKIIKLTDNGVVINMGTRDGINKKTRLGVYRDDQKLMELEVKILDKDILWAKPESKMDIYRLQPGDIIKLEVEKKI
ncbi:MAG: tetratricopeptide repeat protein [Leptospirales bacterium]